MLIALKMKMIATQEDDSRFWGLTFTANAPNVTVSMNEAGSPYSVSIQYCLGTYDWTVDSNWHSFHTNGGTTITLSNVGDKVYFRAGPSGNTRISRSNVAYRRFVLQGSIGASGNIMSLLTQNESGWQSVQMGYHCFNRLFLDCISLTTAPNLPATTLAEYCYYQMFKGCTSLATAPNIPATTLAHSCCRYMFYGCTSLATAPELPATTLAEYCYYGMFYGCSSLATAPELPATTLAEGCYQQMFSSCSSLATAPELPATTLAEYCYSGMFWACTSLATAPDLPATTLAGYCYQWMFFVCASLATVPELPATTLAQNCYQYMFAGCNSLVTAPDLPATTLAEYCYSGMFSVCTSLATAPKLPATTLAEGCYYEMFRACSSLLAAPELPATMLAGYCYYQMFYDCTSLAFVEVGFTSWNPSGATAATSNWLYGVAREGTFVCPSDLEILRDVSYIPNGWAVPTPSTYWGLTFTAKESNVTISMYKAGNPDSITLEASTDDGTTWYPFVSSSDSVTPITLANAGDKVCIRAGSNGNTKLSKSSSDYRYFSLSGYVAASGNIMSLLTQNENDWQSVQMDSSCFAALFWNCTSLTTVPELPATALADSCYLYMFADCTSLATAPELRATTLAQSCYESMFESCTSLATAPELPATTLAEYCYCGMFRGCTSLATAPELPATTLAEGCYESMFESCTSLESAPELPAATLTTNCYQSMFQGCASLAFVKVKFTDWNSSQNSTSNWLSGVASVGSFMCYYDLDTYTRDVSHVPSGWNIIESPDWCLTFTANAPDVTISMNREGNPGSITLEASKDGGHTWLAFVSGNSVTPITLANAGDKVYIRAGSNGNTKLSKSDSNYRYFSLSGYVAASGNIMSLLAQSEGGWRSVQMGSYCFNRLFLDCTLLTTAPNLPATTLAEHCYCDIFRGCTSLATAPELPATTLAGYCYQLMFYGCTSLATAPELPATTLAGYCYQWMFFGCTSLATAPELRATTLAQGCYFGMFSGCTSLATAPELRATTLAQSCYYSMFHDCTSLATAPELPATTLEQSCYCGMFGYCRSLESAPELPATTLARYCYQSMFNGCTSLAFVKVQFTDWNSSQNCTDNWLAGVASSGNFKCPDTLNTIARGVSTVPVNWTVNYWGLTFTAKESNVTISMSKVGNPDPITLEASKDDGDTWFTFVRDDDSVTPITLANAGDKVYIKVQVNVNTQISKSDSDYRYFSLSGPVAASGSIMSLLAQTESECQLVQMDPHCFNRLFLDCTSLTTAPELPATTLAQSCYQYMFWGCTSLVTAPELPATTLAESCYKWMFYDCTSLVTAPKLPATTLAESCYRLMFDGCTSLVSAPELPATTLAESCYYLMFRGTSLATAPELPATTLAQYCYEGMFYGCTSLVTAPELPATTLAQYCYYDMFGQCTSLVTAPDLPATTLAEHCYAYMFFGCTSLAFMKVQFTAWNSSQHSTTDWVTGVASVGSFICPGILPTTRGDSYIPSSWNVVTNEYWGLTFTANAPNVTVSMSKQGSPDPVSLQYCLGSDNWTIDSNWHAFDDNEGTTITLSNIGDRVCFRAATSNRRISNIPGTDYRHFVFNGSVSASGNIMSLLAKDESGESGWQSVEMETGCFGSLFLGCSTLTSAPKLPATTLSSYCYGGMFDGCSSLVSAPSLPATTLAANCYSQMFKDCTTLASAPRLPATTLAASCYSGMFQGCSALTSAPRLPATTLSSGCYYAMFMACSSLVLVEVGFIDWNTSGGSTTDWFRNVAGGGIFRCPAVLDTSLKDRSHIPSDWNVILFRS